MRILFIHQFRKGPLIFKGDYRVTRGCSHINIAKECRSAARNALTPNEPQNYGLVGFRLVRKPINPS